MIVRAALRYFDEELCPHGADAIADYLPGEHVTPEEVRAQRAELDRAQVGYVAKEALSVDAGAGSVAVLVMPHRSS